MNKTSTATIHPSLSSNQLLLSADKEMQPLLALCTFTYWNDQGRDYPKKLLERLEKNDLLQENESVASLCRRNICLLKKDEEPLAMAKIMQCFLSCMDPHETQAIKRLAERLQRFSSQSPLPLHLFFTEVPFSFTELETTIREYEEASISPKSPGIALPPRKSKSTTNLNSLSSKPPLAPMSPPRPEKTNSLENKKDPQVGIFTQQFLFEDSIHSKTRIERKTQEAIFKIPSLFIAKQVLTALLYWMPQKNARWITYYAQKIGGDVQNLIEECPGTLSQEAFDRKLSKISEEEIYNTSQVLLKKLPIEEAAQLRVTLDFFLIANQLIPHSTPSLPPLLENYEEEKSLWINTYREELELLVTLNLSGTGIQTFSEALLGCMRNLENLDFSKNDQPPLLTLRKILSLPKLSHLNLSGNSIRYFPDHLLENSFLKELNFSGNLLSPEDLNLLQNQCSKKEIHLIL